MPQTETRKLDSDDALPELTLNLVGGGELSLPNGQWTLLLIYRGAW